MYTSIRKGRNKFRDLDLFIQKYTREMVRSFFHFNENCKTDKTDNKI